MKDTLTHAAERQLRHIIREEVKRLMVNEAIEFNPSAVLKVIKMYPDLKSIYDKMEVSWRPMEKDLEIIFKSHIIGNPHMEREYRTKLKAVRN